MGEGEIKCITMEKNAGYSDAQGSVSAVEGLRNARWGWEEAGGPYVWVSCGRYNKVPHTGLDSGDLLSRFWEPEVQNQGAGGAELPEESPGKDPSFPPASECLSLHGGESLCVSLCCHTAFSSACIFTRTPVVRTQGPPESSTTRP